MQDIRKPYSHSKSNKSLSSRVEEFESHSYVQETEQRGGPVHIPVRGRTRRNIDDMEMYPRRNPPTSYSDTEEVFEEGHAIYRDPRTIYTKKKPSKGTWIGLGIGAIIVAIILLLTFVFNRATITISPKYQDIDSFNQTISFNQDPLDTQSVHFIVATSSLTKNKVLALSETRKVETKASGSIIIYNNYDSAPQRLIKNTRFESPTGKIYRINQSVTVPGKTASAPGSLEVVVYADSTGSDYNSDPVDFTIPGFKDSPRYKTFYARSKGPLTGGMSGTVSLPSLSDISAAKDELALSLSAELKEGLSKIKKDGHLGMYEAVQINYTDNESELLRGESKTYTMIATGYLAFAPLAELARAIAVNTVRDFSDDPVDLSYGDTLLYTLDAVNLATSTSFTSRFSGSPRIIWSTDKETLKAAVAGKKRDEFKTVMKTVTSINGAETLFYPLWLTRFPAEVSKITIKETLPKR